MRRWSAFTGVLIVCMAACAAAQETAAEDNRTQYPPFVINSYVTLHLGSIRYIFSGDQLESGFKAGSIDIPHLAARLDIGHHFFKHLAMQLTYMRPIEYVVYHNVNEDGVSHQISTTYGGLTLVLGDLPLSARLSAYVEGGWGITNRSGFQIDGKRVVQSAHFGSGLLGAGLAYHAKPNVDVIFGASYSPGRKSLIQPSTRLYMAGLRYRMLPLPAAEVEANRHEFAFPLNVIRLGYTTNLLGYGVNDFFSRRVPIFFGGDVDARRGFTLDYQRNMFHTKKVFAFDFGASASYWTSDGNREGLGTLSVYPLLRFFFARTQPADVYFGYSLAGPTFVSRTVIDGRDTGERFTFQDFMGVGAFLGKTRRMNVEFGVKHYSNGNIFSDNPGVKIPLTLTLGLTF